MKTEYIKIQNTEYKLKIGFGAMMAFEEVTGKSITEIDSKSDIVKLAFEVLKYNNENFKWSYKAFIDEILDSDPELFINLISVISSLIFEKEEVEEAEPKKK